MLTRKMIIGMTVVVLTAMSGGVLGTTYYVDGNDPGCSDSGNGTSWATCFCTIQKGIDTASYRDTVEVNECTYYECIDFKGKTITVKSADYEDWGDEILETIIHANGGNTAVTLGGSTTLSSLLRGFTITGAARHGIEISGGAAAIDYCIITDNGCSSYDGGGMKNSYCRFRMKNCVFCSNTGEHGGGMYNYDTQVQLYNCIFYDNDAADNDGGGMCNFNGSSGRIYNCTFFENTADCDGGGIYNDDSDPELCNCIFWDNYADDGDEVYNDGSSDPNWSHSDIKGCGGSDGGWNSDYGTDGGGNIDDDPEFADDGDLDCIDPIWGDCSDGLSLGSYSPCIDKGDNSAHHMATDLCGSDRVIDGDGDSTATIDMGAYEYDP